MKEKVIFLLDIIFISVISLVQSFSLITFNGVKPNFVLAILVVFVFLEKKFWKYLILVLISLICLNYSVLISKELAVFGPLMLSSFYFKKYLSESIFLHCVIFASILTALFYLLTDPGFIFGGFNLFTLELFYNVSASLIIGYLYHYGYEKE